MTENDPQSVAEIARMLEARLSPEERAALMAALKKESQAAEGVRAVVKETPVSPKPEAAGAGRSAPASGVQPHPMFALSSPHENLTGDFDVDALIRNVEAAQKSSEATAEPPPKKSHAVFTARPARPAPSSSTADREQMLAAYSALRDRYDQSQGRQHQMVAGAGIALVVLLGSALMLFLRPGQTPADPDTGQAASEALAPAPVMPSSGSLDPATTAPSIPDNPSGPTSAVGSGDAPRSAVGAPSTAPKTPSVTPPVAPARSASPPPVRPVHPTKQPAAPSHKTKRAVRRTGVRRRPTRPGGVSGYDSDVNRVIDRLR